MNEIEISGRKIGPEFEPFIIAEIGINHEGSLERAFELVDAAVGAGTEVIKHQTHIVEDEMSPRAKQVIPGNANESIYEIMQKCALSENEEIELQKYVQSKGVIFLSTPFSRAAAERLEKMNVPAYKIGSGECNNYPLIEHIAKFKKPMILSTGMNDLKSVSKAVDIMKKYNVPYALLHTTNLYPTPPNLVRLESIRELKERFPEAVIGLSDHTTTNHACFGAVALGASILERHFIDSMDREGPDVVCSMDPLALKELIYGAKLLKHERGGSKSILNEEQVTIDFAYATVVTIKSIKKGEKFTLDNVWVKRPGTGAILAEFLDDVIGKVSTCDIDVDEHLVPEHIEGYQ